jgi:hypothetical protein
LCTGGVRFSQRSVTYLAGITHYRGTTRKTGIVEQGGYEGVFAFPADLRVGCCCCWCDYSGDVLRKSPSRTYVAVRRRSLHAQNVPFTCTCLQRRRLPMYMKDVVSATKQPLTAGATTRGPRAQRSEAQGTGERQL